MSASESSIKRKKKPSSSSQGSTSEKSPEGKKPRNLSNDIKEDEVFNVSNMADNFASRLDDITRQLNKLDTLSSIEDKLNGVLNSVKQMEEKIEKLDTDVTLLNDKYKTLKESSYEMDRGLEFLNKESEETKTWRKKVDKQIETLNKEKDNAVGSSVFSREIIEELHEQKRKVSYMESYSRRENLKFVGIEETQSEDTKETLTNFLQETLGIHDASYNIEFQRVHRQVRGKPGKPRTIIARFLRYTDVEKILRKAPILKGTKYIIFQDFPKEILDARKRQLGALKEAKLNGKKAAFSKAEPDKLYIDGELYNPDL